MLLEIIREIFQYTRKIRCVFSVKEDMEWKCILLREKKVILS